MKYVKECKGDPREALGVWTEVAGKKAVGGRIMSLNGGTRLNPVGNLSTSGLESPTGTLVTEIVGYSSWSDLQLADFNRVCLQQPAVQRVVCKLPGLCVRFGSDHGVS